MRESDVEPAVESGRIAAGECEPAAIELLCPRPWIVGCPALAPNRVKLIEEIDCSHLRDLIEHEAQLRCALPQETGDNTVQSDCEQREVQLACQRARGERLARSWWSDEQKA